MARCLVTGHKGYIGSHLYRELENQGHEVMGVDIKASSRENIISRASGLRDTLAVTPRFVDFAPEYIFHLACIPRVAYSVEYPVQTMENNVLAGSVILDFARRVGTKRVIYSSSSSVVGNGSGPASPYGLQKLVTEMECKLYADLYGVDTVSLRYFNVYSEDQEADGPYATAVANWMKYIREGKQPFITGTGEQRRDMLHVRDAVAANIFCMNHNDDFNGNHYDVGTGNNISLNEMKEMVQEIDSSIKFDYISERPGDVMLTRANVSSLKALGFQTEISIEEGLRDCFTNLKGE
tara:strand:- start:127 stop:1008 length:882 start_codon:yes stop_codon:yes gene_type:complete